MCLDEFDQITDSDAVILTANLIKALSDKIEPVTIIPVGVADSVGGLIEGHQSVGRNLVQVRMPRMRREELAQIALRGFSELRDGRHPGCDGIHRHDADGNATVRPRSFPERPTSPDGKSNRDNGCSRPGWSWCGLEQVGSFSVLRVRHGDLLGTTIAIQRGPVGMCTDQPRRFGYFSPIDIESHYSMILNEEAKVHDSTPTSSNYRRSEVRS